MHKASWLAVGLGAMVFAAAGCGSDDDSGGSATTDGASNAPASAASDLSGKKMTFAGFGGATQDAQEAAWTTPFAKATGASVQQTGPVDYSKIKVQVESGNVQWDVVDADGFEVAANCGKLFEKLPASVDRSKIDPRYISSDCGVPAYGYAIVIAYDKKFADDPPTTWADFFDTTKYPGKRGMWNYAVSGQLEAALLADGVEPSALYPLDLERATKKLETIKNDIVFTDSLAQLSEQLVSHKVAMSMMWNARGYDAFKQGADQNYAIQWNQSIRGWDDVGVLKGTKNADAAFGLANFIAQPEQQQRFTQQIVYAPLTKDTKPKLDSLQESFLPTTPEHMKNAVNLDQKWWGANYDKANSAWTAFVSG